MKIVICDDREVELEILRSMCQEYAAENSLEADIVCTADAACIEAEQPDILILDIEMPQKKAAQRLRTSLQRVRGQETEDKKAWDDHAVKVPY